MRFYKKSKKFVIARRRAHIYKRLNLLPEPKRNLQRFGFVHLGGGRDENNVRNNLLMCGLTATMVRRNFKVFYVFPLSPGLVKVL